MFACHVMQVFLPNAVGLRRILFSPRTWLVFLLLFAWGLRLYHLDAMSIWWDESLSWDRAISPLPNILANTIRIQDVTTRDLHPPLYFVLLHFTVLLAGTTEFALRFLSAAANLLTLALFVPLARILFGRRAAVIGLLTVLFAALAPFYVWYSQEARPYALVLLWSVLAVYALLGWLGLRPSRFVRRKTALETSKVLWAWVFFTALALTLATHYLSFVLLPFFAATLLIFDRVPSWTARLRSPRAWLAGALLAGFALILFLLPRGGDDLASWDQAGPRFVPFFIMLRDVWNSFAVGLSANLDQVALLDLYLVALWLVGIFATIRAKPRDLRLALWLASWLLVPAAAVQSGSYLRPLYLNSRHLIATSPAFYFGIATGIYALAQRITGAELRGMSRRRPLRPLLAVGVGVVLALPFLAGTLYSLDNLYNDPAYAKDNHKGWSTFLRERLRPDDYLLLVAPQAEKIVEYYAPPGLAWQSLPYLGQTQDWQEFLDRTAVLDAYRNHGRVWFLEIHQPVADPDHHIGDLLHRYGEPVDITYFSAIASRIILQQFVYRGVVQKPDVAIPKRMDVVYGKIFQLLGYDAPPEIEPGGRAAVKLYWMLRVKTPNDLSVSLRVVDADGHVWGQWDAPPVGNLFPVSRWASRVIYLDQHDLVVDAGAPPGEYFIEADVYRAAGHEPLTPRRADGAALDAPVRLGTIRVVRPSPPRDPQSLVMDRHLDVPFGGAVRLVGYDIESRSSNPGSTIPLTLYFQVMENRNEDLHGEVTLAAPWWQFWNRAQSAMPFTLAVANRLPGDIVQARVAPLVPGDAGAGTYSLDVALDGYAPQTGLLPARTVALGDVAVDALVRSTDLPPIAHPLNARLGDGVEFLGYDLSAAQPLKPGDPVKLTLYWRALKPMDTSYKVFTHLLSADEQVKGQQDKQPLDGARPTTSWAPGEVFSDVYEFQVAEDAPPGIYVLEIGMYNPADQVRLPVFDANGAPRGDRVLFGELRVE